MHKVTLPAKSYRKTDGKRTAKAKRIAVSRRRARQDKMRQYADKRA